MAGFDITVCSQQLHTLRQNIRYIINGQHSFEFSVQASIDLVKLELSKTQTRLAFSEDNIEMFATETLRISNPGNGPGRFRWQHQPQRVFQVTPEEGEVPANGFIEVILTYTPPPVPGVIVVAGEAVTTVVKQSS
jgi:hypothetical protein